MWWQSFLLCFVPLFVAMDPLGLVPVFVSITAGYDVAGRRKLVMQAIPAAGLIGLLFFALGSPLLKMLRVEVADMQIAGGALLFVYAMMDLFVTGKPSVQENETVGIVPLATPLIVGPAVLTLGLVLVDQHGLVIASSALVLNLLLLGLSLLSASRVMAYVGLQSMRAASKVVDLLLAAIGVAFVRQGVEAFLRQGLGH